MTELTRNQQSVYDSLRMHNRALSAYELLDELRSQGFRAPSQVYRALNSLLEYGLVHRVESLNAFIACDQEHRFSQIVLEICDKCERIRELNPEKPVSELVDYSSDNGFSLRSLMVEMKGTCSDCE